MEHLGENPPIKFPLSGNWGFKVVKMFVGGHKISKQVPPPAIIVLVSQFNHDAEALLVTTEKLSKIGFNTLRIKEAELGLRRILPH